MDGQGIGSWLSRRAQLTPAKEALVDGARRLTYAQLDQRVNRLARAFACRDLGIGARIAVLSQNRAEYVEILMAAAKAGLTVVPLNCRLAPPELSFVLEDSGAELMLWDPALADLAMATLGSRAGLGSIVLGSERRASADAYEALIDAEPPTEPAIGPVSLETPHIIMYTAGTTGRPKGAVLCQGASFWNALNLQLALDLTSADRDLLVLPLFHIGGIGLFTLPMLYVGGTVVLQRAFDEGETLRLLRDERISLFFGVPAIFLRLLGHERFSREAFDGVRVVMSGGAPLPPSLVREYHERGVVLRQGFGMSEAAPSIATLDRELAIEKAGSVGRPVFHLEARIVDDAMQDVATGEVGELVLRGPNVTQGYWNQPEATAHAFAGGFFHTGDMARMDADGDIWIVDRKKDMFISGGENVYPAEVEGALFELPQIEEAAVVGVPDARWGEVGRAVVVLKKGATLTADEVVAHLGTRLARYKIPKHVAFVEQLPRNAAGKVLKNELRAQGA